MASILLKKVLYWGAGGILCLLVFVFNIKELGNFEPYKQVCYTCAFNVKVTFYYFLITTLEWLENNN